MGDENDKPESEDWGMTMPHLRLEKNKNADDFSDDFAADSYSANQPPKTDWEMSQQDFNLQNSQPSSSDLDNTLPNINIPREENMPREQKSYDWAATAPNINIQQEDKHDDWEMTAPNIDVPKQEKHDDWSMPAPVFRISEGEKVDNLPKRTINFSQNEIDNYDKTTPNFNLSELSPPYPYGSGSANIDSPPSNISKTIPANQTAAAIPKTEKAAGSKLIYLLGGLIAILFFAIVALALVYFLFFRKPEASRKIEAPKEESKQTITSSAYIGETEVTDTEYKKFGGAISKSYAPNPIREKDYFTKCSDAPVVGASFADAREHAAIQASKMFCRRKANNPHQFVKKTGC